MPSERLPLKDLVLVRWVAHASVGDPFPEPWSWASNPPASMIRQLVELGVMVPPAPGADLAAVARDASAAARAWLAEHAPDGPDS